MSHSALAKRRKRKKKKSKNQIEKEKKIQYNKEKKEHKKEQDGRTKLEKKTNYKVDKKKDTKYGYTQEKKDDPYKDMSSRWAEKYGKPTESSTLTNSGSLRDKVKGGRGTGAQATAQTGVMDNSTPPPPPTQNYQNSGGSDPYASNSSRQQPQQQQSYMPPPKFNSYYDPTSGTMKYSPMAKKFNGGNKGSGYKMKGFSTKK